MSQINIQTEQEADQLGGTVEWAHAVVRLIQNGLNNDGECYIDDANLLKIWAGKPWLDADGNLHDRIKNFAKYMFNAEVDWPKKGEAHFTRAIPLIHVVSALPYHMEKRFKDTR